MSACIIVLRAMLKAGTLLTRVLLSPKAKNLIVETYHAARNAQMDKRCARREA